MLLFNSGNYVLSELYRNVLLKSSQKDVYLCLSEDEVNVNKVFLGKMFINAPDLIFLTLPD